MVFTFSFLYRYSHNDTSHVQPIAEQAKAAVESLPAVIEETITRLEKKSKDMEKKEKKAVSSQKMLRDLVEKI